MRPGTLAVGLVSAATWLTGCVNSDFGSPFRQTVEETRALSPEGEFVLENANGAVRVVTWDEPRVRIDATKSAGSRRALGRVEVEVRGDERRVSVRTRHAGGGLFGRGGGVEYDVTVPRSARVSVRNVNGRIEVKGLAGALRVSTVNGAIHVDGAGGEIDASTTNGGIDARTDRVPSSGRNRLSTTNGSLRLVLPADAGAEIDARTVNGSVRCDFDLTFRTRVTRKRLEGRIGHGGARFELRTINGSTHIDRGLPTAGAPLAAPMPEAPPVS